MDETYISFYLKLNRIHVFIDALRGIGEPSRICFMIGEQGNTLLLTPYSKRDFKSHSVPEEVYEGESSLQISSMKLCRIIAGIHGWNKNLSYRVPGQVFKKQAIAVFDLREAEKVI